MWYIVNDFSENASPVPDGGYLFYNKEPNDSSWTGRIIDVALFKGELSKRPLVSMRSRVGSYVTLKPTNKIYVLIGIPAKSAVINDLITQIKKGQLQIRFDDTSDDTDQAQHLIPDAEVTPMTEIDFEKYGSSDIEVEIVEEPISGKLSFNISAID